MGGQQSTVQQEKDIKKRYAIVQEILSTEKTYVESLDTIVEVFQKPLLAQAEEKKKPWLSRERIRAIFSICEMILNVHREALLPKIEALVKTWDNNSVIGNVFIQNASLLKSYTLYVNNFNDALSVLDAAKRRSPELQAFLKEKASDPRCKMLTLEALLIMPVQ
eukprot:Colp12_sorted_trinity150504_noHs@14707